MPHPRACYAAALIALALTGCGQESEPSSAPTASTPTPTATEPPSELVSRDLVTGKGARLRSGEEVSVRYTGVSWSTGEKFDASWDRGTEPFTFPLGAAQVIPGWDEGVAGMRAGGRRLLIIPPDLGYGAEGQPPVIAGNETLVFVVDAVDVS